jgi:NADH-quinone oxidoreductase subunit N
MNEMSSMSRDLMLILPQIIVLLTAVGALIFEMFRKPYGSLWVLILGMLAATGLSLTRLNLDTTAFSETFRIDQLSQWAVVMLCPANILFALLARSELKNTDREGTVYALLTFSTLGALLLAGSGDLMFLVLGILMVGLSGFALAAYPKTDPATEGAMKYFIYGSVTGAIMVFGLTYWTGITGNTLISSLNDSSLSFWPLVFGFAGLVVGIGYAASIFPFHFWTPDTFEGSPVSIAAYLSVTPKIGAIFALAQVVRDLPPVLPWRLILALMAVLSMTFGNVLALKQKQVIRLLAYSTVAQAGYFLLGVLAIQESNLAIQALIVFGIAYTIMNTGTFAYVLENGRNIQELEGSGKTNPFTGAAMSDFVFSLVGIPPLAGFAGKFLLFGSAMEAGYSWLAIVAILNSVISLAVYLKIIAPMYFSAPVKQKLQYSRNISFVISFCLLAIVVLGIGVQWLL